MNILVTLLTIFQSVIEAHDLSIFKMIDLVPQGRIKSEIYNQEPIEIGSTRADKPNWVSGPLLLYPVEIKMKSSVNSASDNTRTVYGNHEDIGVTKQVVILINSKAKTPGKNTNLNAKHIENLLNNREIVLDGENNAIEILDSYESEEFATNDPDYRRKRSKQKNKKYRDRSVYYNSSSSGENGGSSSGSSDYDKNPGNPYTVHKDKYKQNWLWNHKMDGDHMNINPYGPELHSLAPSGAQMFFNRKWWYFNQDDFKPMR